MSPTDRQADKQFVPFDNLWQMRVDVPYSLLVRHDDHAWTSGQIALDADSNVLAAHDLTAQSAIVADYITEVLGRGGLTADHLKRLLLYFVPTSGGNNPKRINDMRSVFRSAFGHHVKLDAIPVPHFYYDGIVLEVDAFAGPTVNDRFDWMSIEVPASDLLAALDAPPFGNVTPAKLLSAHWFVPETSLAVIGAELERRGLVHDAGAVVSAGPTTDVVSGSLVLVADGTVSERTSSTGDVAVTSRRVDPQPTSHSGNQSHSVGWIAARGSNSALGLVEQTERIMETLATNLAAEGVDFDAVVKSTTLYVGDSSAGDLHNNMSIRNRRYHRPGPASTGLPVFALADADSRLTVDILYIG